MYRLLRATLLALPLLITTARSQRPTAKLDVSEREVGIDYGAVPVGKHSLDELPVGGSWRLGFNQASVLHTQLPLLCGDELIAPGAYRVGLGRPSEKQLSLVVAGGGSALGKAGDVAFPGELGEGKPSDKLALEWAQQKPAKGAPVVPATLKVHFSKHEMTLPVQVVGQKPLKIGPMVADLFTYPADVLQGRIDKKLATPVLVVRAPAERADKKSPEAYELLLEGELASFVPLMAAPTEQFGFGPPTVPDAAFIKQGKCEIASAQAKKDVLEAKSAKLEKGVVTLQLAFGEKLATVTVADPLKPGPAAPKK